MFKIKFKSSEGLKFFEGSNPIFVFNVLINLEDKEYQLNAKKQIFNNDMIFDNNTEFQKFDAHLKRFVNFDQKSYDVCSDQISKISLNYMKYVLLAKCEEIQKEFDIIY